MADQWNLFFWLEWVGAAFLVLFHLVAIFPRNKRPVYLNALVALPAVALIILLILSLVKPSFRWPLYPMLALTLADLAYVLATLKSMKKPGTGGLSGVLRMFGSITLFLASLVCFGLVVAFPPPPNSPDKMVSMSRIESQNGVWLRFLREKGGRDIRWYPNQRAVLDDYLDYWTIPRLEESARNSAPAILVLNAGNPYSYRMLLEELTLGGFEVWCNADPQEELIEQSGWGPPQSWNWLRWPEFLSKLTNDAQSRWAGQAVNASKLTTLYAEGSRLASAKGKRIEGLVLLGAWENLARWRLPGGLKTLILWNTGSVPLGAQGMATFSITSTLDPKPASVRAMLTLDGAKPAGISDESVLRPWMGLPHLSLLGSDASLRYNTARELARRFLQTYLLAGDPEVFEQNRLEMPGKAILQGTP